MSCRKCEVQSEAIKVFRRQIRELKDLNAESVKALQRWRDKVFVLVTVYGEFQDIDEDAKELIARWKETIRG